jgi:hypothetical protein
VPEPGRGVHDHRHRGGRQRDRNPPTSDARPVGPFGRRGCAYVRSKIARASG